MFKTKIAILAMSAVTAATTAAQTEMIREYSPPSRSISAIPVPPVGDTVSAKVVYSPVTQCDHLEPGMDIDIISACAAKRVGWLKL